MNEHIAILYHNDMDGLVACWSALRHLQNPLKYVSHFPVQYDTPLPTDFKQRAWSAIYILDYALPPIVFDALLAHHNGQLVMLDHHKTAAEKYGEHWQMDGLGASSDPYIWTPDASTRVVFHIGVAGCAMAEYYFQGLYDDEAEKGEEDIVLPKLVQYTADHDLWTFALPHSRLIRAAFRSYPMTLATCDTLGCTMATPSGFDSLVQQGAAIERDHQQIIRTAVENAEWMTIDGCTGRATEMPVSNLISDVAGALASQDGADFGCCWFKIAGENEWVYSLRSRDAFDVGALAKQHGGGGHPRAAGFKSSWGPTMYMQRPNK